ncbi:MAG: hypothetical protein Q4C48_04805 [Lachnospiraceae bacterium]|nr:hypothetical protein [Lachnospiraceae bacterium]
MKNITKKIMAIMLLLALFAASIAPTNTAAAAADPGSQTQQTGVNIPIGGDVSGYDPEADGYYGYLPVKYEAGRSENGEKAMALALVPVLVAGGHLFISDDDIEGILGLSMKKGGTTRLIYAYERSLALSCGTTEAQFFLGADFWNDTFDSVSIKLSAAPIFYKDKVWVPFQDLAIMFDLGMHTETIDGEAFVTVYAPEETAIDVLSYLYYNSADLMTAYQSDNLALLSGTAAAAQIAAKMLDGDATAWGAVALSAIGKEEEAKEKLIRQIADDLTVDLMVALPDETVKITKEATNGASDLVNWAVTCIGMRADAELDLDLAAAEKALDEAGKTVVTANDTQWYKEALDRLNSLKMEKDRISATGENIGTAVNALSALLGVLSTMVTYASVDEISANGIDTIRANKEYLNYTDGIVLDEIVEYAEYMRSGMVEYSVSDYVRKNFGGWILDGLTQSCPAFSLVRLSSHLVPFMADGVEATHSFQVSMLSIPLQSDTERVLKAVLKKYKPRNADQEGFRYMMDAAYVYLKTCYISRNTATAALYMDETEMEPHKEQMEFLLEKMAILSSNYNFENYHENLYDKYQRLLKMDDTAVIEQCVKPLYLNVGGQVLKEADESPVNDAQCAVYDINREKIGYFDGTPGGSYANLYVPVLEPDGWIAYVSDYKASVSLRFTSPTVDGEDEVGATGEPGGSVSVPTAYLGSGGFASASVMGVIDGKLYSLRTRHINESEGIQLLDIFDDGDGYSTASFAYCCGKIYYCEKTSGTSDCIFRLGVCEKDGSGKRILMQGKSANDPYMSWGAMDFYVEDDKISWTVSNSGFQMPDLVTYNTKTGELSTDGSADVPLTRLAFEKEMEDISYGAEVKVSENEDGTWTLWQLSDSYDYNKPLRAYTVEKDKESNELRIVGTVDYGYLYKPSGLFAVYDGYVYVSTYENNDGILCKVKVGDPQNQMIEIGRHITAGGGDPFFNY